MTPAAILSAPPTGASVRCAVAAHAALRLTADAIAGLRKPTHPVTGAPLPQAFLKNADEQTVATLAAVFQAIRDGGLHEERFTDWGAIAAPRFLGRATMSMVLHRFGQEGAWGVSPHHIPHRSLHAVSGTISLALKINGPNFGVGGGPGADSEVMLIAAGLLAQRAVPGLWVVVSGYAPEVVPPDPNVPAPPPPNPPPSCQVVALALKPLDAGRPSLQWHFHPSPPRAFGQVAGGSPSGVPHGSPPTGGPSFSVEALRRALTGEAAAPAGGWQLSTGGRVELRRSEGRTACE